MNSLLQLLLLPLQIIFELIILSFKITYYIFKFSIIALFTFIVLIISIFKKDKKKNNIFDKTIIYKYDDDYKITKKGKNKIKEKSWKDAEFEEKSNSYGLSKEERKRAKEERMTPEEFIEAEERDDDNLDTDD